MRLTELSRWTVFVRLLLGAVCLLGISLIDPARAQEAAEQQTDSDGEAVGDAAEDRAEKMSEGATKEESLRPTLDLGKFKIHDLRPTRNETAKVSFTMFLALSPTLTKQQVTQLERWQHRLRDQVIIAIRTLEVREFQEPDLSRLRRKILIRVNRLFQSKLAEEVLMTEYLFRTH